MTLRHRLTLQLIEEHKAAGIKPSAAMREAFKILDNLAARQSAGGKAAAGHSGRPKIQLDVAEVRRQRESGVSVDELAVKFGVSPATIRRAIAVEK